MRPSALYSLTDALNAIPEKKRHIAVTSALAEITSQDEHLLDCALRHIATYALDLDLLISQLEKGS
jgi:hypothetical protein